MTLEAFFFTSMDSLSVSRNDARSPHVVGMPIERKAQISQAFSCRMMPESKEWTQEEPSTTSVNQRAGEWVHGRTVLNLF